MAAENNPNWVTVTVKSMTGDLVEISFDRTQGALGARNALHQLDPQLYPLSKIHLLRLQDPEGQNGTDPSVNKLQGNITETVTGDMFLLVSSDRVATLLTCTPADGEPEGTLEYVFDVQRGQGAILQSAVDLRGRELTANEIQSLVERYPFQRVVIHYEPDQRRHLIVTPDPLQLQQIRYHPSSIYDGRVVISHFYSHYGPANNNQYGFYANFYDPSAEGQEMGVARITYELTPEAMHDIRKEIKASPCTPAEAEILQHVEGGRRVRKGTSMRKGTSKRKQSSTRKGPAGKKGTSTRKGTSTTRKKKGTAHYRR